MEIVLNGKRREVAQGVSVLGLIEELGIARKAMAVAVNTQVVQKARWAEQILESGDEVEILDFVGGG